MNRTSLLLILSLAAAYASGASAQDAPIVTDVHSFTYMSNTPSNADSFNYPPDPNGTVKKERYCLPRDLTLVRVNDVKASESNGRTTIDINPDLQANCFNLTVTMPAPESVCASVPRLSGLFVEQTKTCQLVPTKVSFAVSYDVQKANEAQKVNKSPAVATNETVGSQRPFTEITGRDWRASKLVGLNVYNDKNENIGSINDLITANNGSIQAVILSVGGFLGMGSHLVAVSFDKVKFSNEPVAYVATSNDGSHEPTKSTTGAASSSGTTSTANRWTPDHAVLSATKDELKAAPEFKYAQ